MRMKTKLLSLFLALAASVGTMFAEQITVAQALQIAGQLEQGATTAEEYEVVGYVTAYAGADAATDGGWAKYSNQIFWIADEKGTAASNADGALEIYQGVPSEMVYVGDKVSVKATLTNYNGLLETTKRGVVTILEKVERPAFSGKCMIGDLYYNLKGDKTAEVTYKSYADYTYNKGWNITTADIPASVTYSGTTYSVTSIGNSAFSGCSRLSSVTIPNSVTSIGRFAFEGCSGLTSVTIGNSVTSIGGYAFAYCSSLTSVTIPNSVTSIGEWAFEDCSSLTSVTIPNSVTSIGERAFQICSSLTSVTIGNSVTSIGEYAFIGCYGLTSLSVEAGNTVYDSRNNCNAIIETATNTLIVGCQNTTIPNTVTSIGDFAFDGCSGLTSVTIPNSVTSIGYYAFNGCSSLTSIYVPCGEMERFKQLLNNDSRVKYAPVPYSITINAENGSVTYPQTMCDDMQLTATPYNGYHFVKWSDGNTDNPREILLTQDTTFTAEFAVDKSGVCGDDNLLTWTFDDESKTLAISGKGTLNSNYTFGVEAPTQTERLIIAEGVTSVGNNAFKDMSSTITSLALPSTVTEIGDYAFAGMNNRKFNTLVLPNTIIRIGAHAFDGASYLQTIHFGSTLEEIGDYAFNGCTRVKQMTCLAEITPNVGTDGLTSINSLAELYVPNEYLFDYQIDSNWSRFVLKPYGATETTVTDNDVAVVADDNTATFTWPTSNTADSYTIDITKDGVLFCQLTFNANGQLTGIAFAPGRNEQSMAPAATLTTSGMQFTVTGLNSGTNYAFSLTVKSGSTVVASYSGSFTTTGVATSTDVLQSNLAPCKFIRDNQVLILRGGKTYTIQGVEVK